ncbi:MAG: SMP-30/gluconolactonase/LRE family protein [Planctomycetes bacterium]|nr:SMP-30/gluconolactonase/LRE family protein [Planctomycetota bacterium]
MRDSAWLRLAVLAGVVAWVCFRGTASAESGQNLIAPGSKVVKLAGGFRFTEGPACDAEGNVYFSDIPTNRTYVWSVDGKLSVFRENTGGGNGLYFDAQGNLLVCEGKARRVTSVAPDGTVTVLADRYQGKRFNSPNDLWVDPRGGIYFTDPRYGRQDGLELDGFYVYYITPDRREVRRVIDDLVKPNGIVGTADGRLLYVADAGDSKIYRYRIQPDGSLTDKTLFAPQGSDGMTLDERGNLYLTKGTVAVYSPAGEKILDIKVPEAPANVCFGGKDRKTLFITARKGLYALRMTVRGQ